MSQWHAVSREAIARQVVRDIPAGSVINLGIGLPERVGDYLPADAGIVVHTENGIIGSAPIVAPPFQDFDLINAGRKPVQLIPGGHFVDHVDSFALVRGGHLDITVLGAFQVSANGDLANWSTGDPNSLPSPGGAMDLAVGAKQVFAMMNLFDKSGRAKLCRQCSLPLTASGVVTQLYTDLAVFQLSQTAPPMVRALVQELDLDTLQDLLQLELDADPQGIAPYLTA